MTAAAVQTAWPTTVPIVTRYMLYERSMGMRKVRVKRLDAHEQQRGQL